MAGFKFSFSYSRWAVWAKCPYQFKLKHVDKTPVPTGPALIKGRKVHDDIANWLDLKENDMPSSLRLFSQMGEQLRSLPKDKKLVEKQMAFDKDRKPVSWFGANAYYRFIWDVGVKTTPTHFDAVDWKTGKPYGSYDDQKQMFALPAFWTNPQLETFSGHWVYLDHGEVHDVTYNRAQVFGPTCDPAANDGLHGMWQANAAMMEADRAYRPKPSKDACRFCDFHKNKGGQCEFGV